MEENHKYQAFAILKDGTRQPIEAESIIIQLEE